MQTPADLLLIMDSDPASSELLRALADGIGCEHVEPASVEELEAVLAVRRPTVAALSVDRLEADGYAVLHTLAQHGMRPPTLILGDVDNRVLASVRRTAESRGLNVIGTHTRPLVAGDLESALSAYIHAPMPISREEILRALSEYEFSLRYQPKYEVGPDDLTMKGVEALVRWEHPQRGELPPRHFLSAVESFGLVGDLTDFVITEAIRQASVWQNFGMNLELVINLSPRLVKDRGFPDRLASLLREHNVPPGQIIMDVTETAGTGDRELMLDVFTGLRIMGVGLSLDNFGTGMSSLTELYRIPYSEIKVDRVLLTDVPRERDAEIIVRSIAKLAHDLGLSVCAEGVETKEIFEFVRSAHFDTVQGHYFCGAVRANEIERLVRSSADSSESMLDELLAPRGLKSA
ncbi:MAG: EAL domain-containing response regulator [Pseudomonadota bacterium]|nr:EAL domain-containing response regulator [Pseudomonadota bacterium]